MLNYGKQKELKILEYITFKLAAANFTKKKQGITKIRAEINATEN